MSYSLRKTTTASELPVTLADVKAHLRVTWDVDDALLSDMMARTAEEIEGICGIPMGLCTFVQTADEFPEYGPLALGRKPAVSVTSVAYYDTDGTLQTLDPSLYFVGLQTGKISPNLSFPDVQIGRPESVTITFTSGMTTTLPPQIESAFLLMMANRFERRGTDTTNTSAGMESLSIPPAAMMLLNQVWQGDL